MSSERSQDPDRRRKREAIQKPIRQGIQWVGRQFDELRSRSSSPRLTRPHTPTAIPSGSTPLRRDVVREDDGLAPPSVRLLTSNSPQEISPSSGSQAQSVIPSSLDVHEAQKGHSSLLPEHGFNHEGDGLTDSLSLSSSPPTAPRPTRPLIQSSAVSSSSRTPSRQDVFCEADAPSEQLIPVQEISPSRSIQPPEVTPVILREHEMQDYALPLKPQYSAYREGDGPADSVLPSSGPAQDRFGEMPPLSPCAAETDVSAHVSRPRIYPS
ncbi:hypothetical protein BKA70DRAFT_1355673 [Coprinopsis sp. MPI-PUGE-AT-0042]|nr:hypothetical protein BKA70DRAFT_1355673 [Coprinopsis sp. MPI-PUGE-AT-0042]